jgi:hypothetical protein
MPYRDPVHAVLETLTFLRDVAESGMSEDQLERIVRRVAENPGRETSFPARVARAR